MTTRMTENAARRAQLRGKAWPAGGRVFLAGLALALCLVWWMQDGETATPDG